MLLLNGDCIEQMQKLKDEGKQIDSVVTDPPYHLTSIVERYGKEGSAPAKDKDGLYQRQARGFMGKEWDGGDIAFRSDTWKLAYDLLKPGGYLLAFSASRNYHRMAVAIEDAGFEIRDQIMWIYGSGFPKSLNIGKAIDKRLGNEREVVGTRVSAFGDADGSETDDGRNLWGKESTKEVELTMGSSEYEGWGTALKPAHEPIVMARKPLEGSNIDNVLKYGTGAINIDGCRVEGEVKRPDTNPDFRDVAKKAMEQGGQDKLNFNQVTGAKRKTTNRKPRDGDNVWTDDNSGMKQEDNHFADADPRGRYPSNVMHDGSDVVKDIFPKTTSTKVSRERKAGSEFGQNSGWNKHNNRDSGLMPAYGDDGSASRYFYCPKVSKEERNRGLDSFETKKMGMSGGAQSKGEGYDKGQGIGLNRVIERKNTHPTVKPQELMKYLCRLVTPKGGVVLDPFMGSGSTGIAAKDEGFDFIGIEKEEEYFQIASARIKVSSPLMEFM